MSDETKQADAGFLEENPGERSSTRLKSILTLFASFAAAYLAVAAIAAEAPGLTLRWNDNSNNEDGFLIEKGIGQSGAFVLLTSVPANTTSYRDTDVLPGVTYRYRLRAYNTAGNSPYSNTATGSLPPVGSAPSAPGEVILEIPGKLANISNRGLITVGDGTMIPGFVVADGPLKVLIRVVGPTIGAAPYNVPGVCADPRLSLRNQAGQEIASNDNWLAADAAVMAQVGAFALPAGSKDAAIVITLQPGNYTVVTSGVGGAQGVAIAEVYAVP